MFLDFLTSPDIYSPADILKVIDKALNGITPFRTNKKIEYYNVSCAFDIETTSFYDEYGKKTAIMYEWTFGMNGLVIIGRTWEQLFTMLDVITVRLNLDVSHRLVIYVHNLAYEFQFIRKWLSWKKVFAVAERKPIYAVTLSGLEFRCSYLLSGYSLAKLGENLQKYHVKKLVGDLDYEKVRNSKTPLTPAEIGYCVNDVKVVMAYIQECMESDGDISRIPYTKTGYVRNYCRNQCFYENGKRRRSGFKRLRYRELMNGLRLTPEEYKQLKRAFQGGFTHANPFASGKTYEDVASYDFTSSYPAVMIAEQFPMSSSEVVQIKSKEEFEKNLKYYCCLFDVEITGLESVIFYENYLSISRCWGVSHPVVDNGRVVAASKLYTTITEQDYMIMKRFYKWDSFKVGNFRRYKKGYLPTDFVKAILELYKNKTTLKGVQGKEVEYLQSKEMLNSCYGMAVTDIVRTEYKYDTDWFEELPDFEKEIRKYNNSPSRFLFYPWGVWVTAYARRNLFSGILAYGTDYIYSDTDSVKGLHPERHQGYIDTYNEIIRKQLYKAMDFHGLQRDAIEPETIQGKKKCLGVWDYEGVYNRFKTLGAKRYMTEKDGDISITVSGLNKKVCVPYLLDKYGDGIFDAFTDGLYIPPEHTGKNTHTYIDEARTGTLTDYLGITADYYERSCVHLMAADYSLSVAREYADYIMSVQDEI